MQHQRPQPNHWRHRARGRAHIAGGHILRGKRCRRTRHGNRDSIARFLASPCGAATGEGGAAAAGSSLGTGLAGPPNFFAFSRTQESAADQAALSYLDRDRPVGTRHCRITVQDLRKSGIAVGRQSRPLHADPSFIRRTHAGRRFIISKYRPIPMRRRRKICRNAKTAWLPNWSGYLKAQTYRTAALSRRPTKACPARYARAIAYLSGTGRWILPFRWSMG